MRRALGVMAALLLAGCSGLLPPTPTPVDFVFPTPTVEPTATVTPPPTPEPTEEVDTRPTRQLNPGDEVSVTFEARAEEAFSVRVTVEDGSPRTRLVLRDRFGNTLIEAVALATGDEAAIDSITLPYTGLYRVVLSTEGQAGTVRVAIEAAEAAGNVTPFEPLEGTEGRFEAGVRGQAFRTRLEAGQHLRLLSSMQGVTMRLHGPDGGEVLQADTQSDPFTVGRSGNYILLVTHSGPGGAYTLRAVDETRVPVAEGQPSIPPGEVQRYRFVGDEPARLSFDGGRGEVIAINLFDLTEEISVDVLVRSPFGQVIAVATEDAPGAGARIGELQLPYDGRYTLELRPRGDGEASYRIDALPVEVLTGGGLFGAGRESVLAGNFNAPGTFHVAQFEARFDEVITLRLRDFSGREGFSPALALIAPDGGQLAAAITDEGEMPVIEGYPISQNGLYTVIVYTVTDVGGRYEITLERR